METFFALLVLVALYAVYKWLGRMWDEWSGAYTRWQRGEPLRASHLRAQHWAEERARRDHRRCQMRSAYEADPYRILNREFRAEFVALDIHHDIRSEVVRRCGYRCGGCGREIRRASTLHIDHIRPKSAYPALEFLASNLQVLCSKCNMHKHAYDGDDWREVTARRRKAHQAKKAKARRAGRGVK